MIQVLVRHSSKVFNDLPMEPKVQKRLNKKERFLEKLSDKFDRQQYLKTADELNIPHKTAEGYITGFVKIGLVHRDKHNEYLKPKDYFSFQFSFRMFFLFFTFCYFHQDLFSKIFISR